jgi:hypothetical protein
VKNRVTTIATLLVGIFLIAPSSWGENEGSDATISDTRRPHFICQYRDNDQTFQGEGHSRREAKRRALRKCEDQHSSWEGGQDDAQENGEDTGDRDCRFDGCWRY